MAALLVAMAIMAILMSVALPVWNTQARREREEELIFRGNQYARAIALFQRKYAGAFPPNLDVLVRERYLRKKYTDPITGGDFQVVAPGTPIQGQAAGAQRPGIPATGPGGRGGSAQSITGASAQAGVSARPPAIQAEGRTAQTAAGRAQAGASSAGIMGVASRSTEKSLRLFNGQDTYNAWVFVATQASRAAGAPTGAAQPGRGGAGRGAPGAGPRGGPPPIRPPAPLRPGR